MSQSKTLLIIGASSGIGAATAKLFVKHGHSVILVARREEKLQLLQQELGEENVLTVCADATNKSSVKSAFEQGISKFGSIDAVFANAGRGLNKAGVENGDPDEWDDMLSVNVNALLYAAKYAMPVLKKSKGDFIITSSIAGRRILKGSVYGASKWFTYGFAQNLAEEMAEWGGRCTTISPGMVNTEFFDQPHPDKLQPEDVAEAVFFAVTANSSSCIREVCLMPTD